MKLENLRIETLTLPDMGGQHVGLISRGVKVTHIPTGLTASCDTERSQIKNRDVAISRLEWGLVEIGVTDKESEDVKQD